jgi:hypothetical protein
LERSNQVRTLRLTFGILGGIAAGSLGLKWLNDASQMRDLIDTVRNAGLNTTEIDNLVTGAYLLIASMVLGVTGGILAFKGRGKLAAALMLLGALAPVVFAPRAIVFTSLLLIAGILSFTAKPEQKGAHVEGLM